MADLRLYQSGSSIAAAWRPLALHADQCDVCLPHVRRLVGALNPRETDFDVFDELCDSGKELFTPWLMAKWEWLEGTREGRRHRFITDEQLAADRVAFEVRAEAVMSMPNDEYRSWLLLPDERRHAQLLALEAGLPRNQSSPANGPLRLVQRTCRLTSCGRTFQVAPDSKDRYCCEEHRREGWSQR